MATIYKEFVVNAPRQFVWDAIKEAGAVHTRLAQGFVVDTVLNGDTRTVTFANGFVVQERLLSIDDEHWRFCYSAVGGRAAHHNAYFQVADVAQEKSLVTWVTDLLPDEVRPSIEQMVELGSAAIQATIERAYLARPSAPSVSTAGETGAGIAVGCIREIDHLVLRVVDLDRMLRFYCGALGCTVERRQDDLGLVQLRAGRSLIDLVPVDGKLGRAGGAAPGREGRNLDHFCLRMQPFDERAIRALVREHGIPAGPLESRYGAEGQGPSIYLTDPEGNTVELKGPPAG